MPLSEILQYGTSSLALLHRVPEDNTTQATPDTGRKLMIRHREPECPGKKGVGQEAASLALGWALT